MIILFFILTAYYFVYMDGYPNDSVVLEIPKVATSDEIGSILKSNSIIRSKHLFLLIVLLKGSEGKLQAGEYKITSGMSLNEIVNTFISGKVWLRKITIPEGKNLYEISEILDEQSVANGDEFIRWAMDGNYASLLIGTEVKSLEGYLYPDTYMFSKDTDARKVIRVMTDRFRNIYDQIRKENRIGLSDHEIVILASMIEKEAANSNEKEHVSAVFHNRLKKGMKLESDPTAVYIHGKSFKGRITRKHLKTSSIYNTYKIYGLPPGPISNPGRDSILSASNPSDADYLFFVLKDNGTHHFSRNYKEHAGAIRKYIKGKGKN